MLLPPSSRAQTSPLLGNWREPTGSVIHVEQCASGLCLRLVLLSPKAPATVDVHNPDAAQRNRSLCDLVIGSRFQLNDATHASEGTLYDPKSGKTYRGTMTVMDNTLMLRGYVGLPVFGKTESWQRVSGSVAPCRSSTTR